MLSLTLDDILLNQVAADKHNAIVDIAASLANKGLVQSAYVDGLLAREAQSSTFLGNGIAIPHGTLETKALVEKTGVSVHHFPQGVDWGNGTVYVAIGIAAKSDEHLSILKQLTKVLSADGIENLLKNASSQQDILDLLMGKTQTSIELTSDLISLGFPASDDLQLRAVGAGLLKQKSWVDSSFVGDIVSKQPSHLGQGVWLSASNQGVTQTGVSIVSSQSPLTRNDAPVKMLITLAACNHAHANLVETLTELSFKQELHTLVEADAANLAKLLGLSAEDEAPTQTNSNDNQAVFKIKNAHGLHARPGAMLVASAKKFESKIMVRNLDGDQKFVNAKSLMKVIAMGVKHGHQLEFVAEGTDAAKALQGIGEAIESGLGES